MAKTSESPVELRLLKFQWFRPAALLDSNLLETKFVIADHVEHLSQEGRWIQPEERYLCAPRHARWIETRPLDDPYLINAFAQPRASENVISKLCQTYGMLFTHGLNPVVRYGHRPDIHTNETHVIDTVSAWRSSMTTLAIAIKLHEYVNYQITSIELRNYLDDYLQPSQREQIKMKLQINSLREFSIFEAQLLLSMFVRIGSNMDVQIRADSHKTSGRLEWSLVPQTLESAIWTLFLQSIAGQGKVKRCQHCAKIYTHALHQDCMYCSGACKQRASRKRRRQQA